MKVVILHPPMYPVNHEFFNLLGKEVELTVYQFGTHPVHHKNWTVDHFKKGENNYKIKVFGSKVVTFLLQANPYFLINLKKDKPDIVISIAFWIPSLYAAVTKKILGFKFIVSTDEICETAKGLPSFKKNIRRIICKQSDSLISASDLTTEYINQLHFKTEIFQSNQTINTSQWIRDLDLLPNKELIKKQLNIPNDKTILLGVGNFINKKNWENVFKQIKSFDEILFVLIGAGELKYKYNEYIANNNLQDKVMLVSRKDGLELKKYFKISDIFIFPSYYDQFGFVVLEALASGLPVICTKYAGASSLIEDAYNGYVVNPNMDYSRQVKEVITHLDAMKKNARNSSLEISLEGRVVEFLNLFESLVK
jgi:glycosyltransferase involved in cell wall biosynthesis